MKLAPKLTLLLAIASAGPLLGATVYTVTRSGTALSEQMSRRYREQAFLIARLTQDYVDGASDRLASTIRTFRLEELGPEAVAQFVKVVQIQTPWVNAAGLYDSSGKPITSAGSLTQEHPTEELLQFHEPMNDAALTRFVEHINIQKALQSEGPSFSEPYVSIGAGGKPTPRVALTAKINRSDGTAWVLAVELSLKPLLDVYRRSDVKDTADIMLLDETQHVIIHKQDDVMAARADMASHPALSASGGVATLGNAVKLRSVPWMVLISEPAASALAPLDAQKRGAAVAVILGLLGAALVGITAVRTVTGPLRKLREAAAKVAAGDFEVQVDVRSKDELAQVGGAFNDMTRGLKERARLKQSFRRYVSGEIAERILSETSDLNLKGEQVEATVLFVDMRGFTSLSEKHTPREVVDLLNSYFEEIVGAVLNNEGVINKFMGDAVMAVFGVPRALPDPECRAVAAAVEIQQRIARLNAERREKGLEVAHFGVGINTGAAIAGNLGSAERMEYTVIGDAVNTAQRLLGQAREGEIIISRTTVNRVQERFVTESRGAVKVRGKELPVETFAVLSARPATAA